MADETAIDWTDHTFNPWWGCTEVHGPGGQPSECDGCYARTQSIRYGWSDEGNSGPALWGPTAARRFLSDANWRKPLAWDRAAAEAGRPALVFCGSFCDVFEARQDLDEQRARLWELIEETPNLIWQLLTKRPEHVLRMVPQRWVPGTDEGCTDPDCGEFPLDHAWPSNVWVGTSAGTAWSARVRIPRLLRIPAPVRFVSAEPLLQRVDLQEWITDVERCPVCNGSCSVPAPGGGKACDACYDDVSGQGALTTWVANHIGWVIAGGESGPGHRGLNLDHARLLRDQCALAGIPYFFKQVGGATPKAGGILLDEQLHYAWPAAAGDRSDLIALAAAAAGVR